MRIINNNLALLVALLFFPLEANAFGVISAPVIGYVYAIFLGLLGVAGNSARRHSKAGRLFLFSSLALLICFLGAQSHLSDQYLASALENEYFPGDVKVSFNPDDINFVSLSDAIETYRSSKSTVVRISEKKIPYINGSDVFYYKDAKRFSASLTGKQIENIIVVSQYMAEGIIAYNEISGHFSGGVQYLDISNFAPSSQWVTGDANANAILHVGIDFDQFNYLTIYGARSYNTYIMKDAYLMSDLSLLFWSDKQWADLKVKLGDKKPIKVMLPENTLDSQNIVQFIAAKLGLDMIYYESPVGDDSESKLIPFLWRYTDNNLTERFENSDSYLSPSSLYAKVETSNNIVVICFSERCTEQYPKSINSISILSAMNADAYSLYGIQDGKLKFNTSLLDSNKEYILSPEDSSTLMLAINMAKSMSDAGLSFLGFTYHFSNYYGSVFASGGGEGDLFVYDSPPIKWLTGILVIKERAVDSFLHHSSVPTTIALYFIISMLYFTGAKGRFAALAGLLLLSLFIRVDAAEITLPEDDFPPLAVGLLSALLFLSSKIKLSKDKLNDPGLGGISTALSCILTVLITAYFVSSMDFTTVVIYSFAMSLIITITCLKWIYFQLTPSVATAVGEKYNLTIPFLQKNKGFLVTFPGFKIKNSLSASDLWIVRSNHLVDNENGAAGIYESLVVPSRLIESTIEKMVNNANSYISLDKIQFWLQPYILCSHRGVVESISQSLFFSIGHSYSEGNETSVNDGTNHARYVMIDRDSKVKSDRKIISMITNIEMKTGYPVIIEYGIDMMGSIHIFQVRRQSLELHFDDDIAMEFILTPIDKRYLVETCRYSPLHRSILFHLYGKSIFIDAVCAYRKKSATTHFDEAMIASVINHLANSNSTLVNLLNVGIGGIIDHYAKILAPLKNMHCKDSDSIGDNSINCFNLAINHAYGKEQAPPPSAREFLRLPFMIALKRVESDLKFLHRGSNIDMASLKASVTDAHLLVPAGMEAHIESMISQSILVNPLFDSSYEVYPGDFSKQTCTLSESLAMNPLERAVRILRVECIPTGDMMLIKDHAGIISLYGGPLSHLAITAKYYHVPCRIGRRYFFDQVK